MKKLTQKKKERNSKKHIALKVAIYSSVVTIAICFSLVVSFKLLLKDKVRNSFKDEGITNEEIIQKEYVNALASMNDNFVFKLTKDDVNQMLTNSLKSEKASKYVSSAYYDQNKNNHIWYFDLNVPMVNTRLIVNTHIDQSTFVIDSLKMGKVNAKSFFEKKIKDEIFDTIFKNANLPIKSDIKNNVFIYEPARFIENFNINEITSEIFSLENISSRVSVEKDYVGFKLNLSDVGKSSFAQRSEIVDLLSNLKVNLLEEPYSTLTVGTPKVVYFANEETFSNWISTCYSPSLILDEISSGLTSTKVEVTLMGVSSNFVNDHLVINWNIKLGEKYLEVSYDLEEGYPSNDGTFKLTFFRKSPEDESNIQKTLMDDFIDALTKQGYAYYDEDDLSITFDFENVFLDSSLTTYKMRTIREVNLISNALEFNVTRLY